MRIVRILTLMLLLTLILGAPAVPTGIEHLSGKAASAKSGKGHGKPDKNENGGDHDRGHGNDPDGVDEDNPGKGNKKVVQAGDYTVDVSCTSEDDGTATTCVYTPVVPEGGKKVASLHVPDDTLCAPVTDTDGKHEDAAPETHASGYRAEGKDGVLTVTMEGVVSATEMRVTYWVKAAGATLPATGPAISCAEAQARTAAETLTPAPMSSPTETVAPDTGTVVVEVSSCADMPADTSGFDWFGACQPGGQPVTFSLTSTDDASSEARTTDASADGVATFDNLAPGTYSLDAVDGSWCHAASDNVDADSNLVVQAGATTTVWIFMCGGMKGGA